MGAEIGLSLALDAGDQGRVEGVALAAVPALAEAPQLSRFSRWLLQGTKGLAGGIRGSNISTGVRPGPMPPGWNATSPGATALGDNPIFLDRLEG